MASQPTHAGQDTVTERVLKIIADNQKKDVSVVTVESSFEELNIDSMDAVNIVFALENEFNVNVPDEEMKNIRSVRDIVEGMQKLVEQSPDGPKAA
ncbi:MAG TPA: phosphopantetheine-binding protein [Bryobacteraceae bacterium]|jgi:acyl carrier protein|nr:phosphopantetheine-binding protein [Bryobacteraceae bacterium]